MESTLGSDFVLPSEVNYEKIYLDISKTQNFKPDQVKKTLELLLTGNTVPFVARYRKEVTGALNESDLRGIQKEYTTRVSIEERKISVLGSIHSQNKLTEILLTKIQQSETLQEIEDLYLPYKKTYKTLGAKAREKGLQPLADLIRQGATVPDDEEKERILAQYVNPEKEVKDGAEAISGAIDIIAEEIGADTDVRQYVRDVIAQRTVLHAKVNEEKLTQTEPILSEEGKAVDPQTFEIYFNFDLQTTELKNHQILALNRAEDLDIIDLDYETPDENLTHEIKKMVLGNQTPKTNMFYEEYEKAIDAGYKRYIIRSLKRELWRSLFERAEKHAIEVFATNLRNLLMTPPLKNRAIVGIDPGYRTGCKVAVIDNYGKFLDHDVIYPHPPHNKSSEAEEILIHLAKKYNATTFAIGNGTASRETEQLVASMARKNTYKKLGLEYAIVSEAGASIYSASEVAIEEFPDLDLTVRGAISIARRLQDPLSELIKIEPKSIGIGLYQHDVNQTELKQELDAVIEDCVNSVGVNLDTASSKLLEYVSGLTKRTAKKIVEHRNEFGGFASRQEILKISGIGAKSFEQCAGFLKIPDAKNPLDSTFIHPESYEMVLEIFKELEISLSWLIETGKQAQIEERLSRIRPRSTAEKYNTTPEKIRYLVEQLLKPNLDPREDLPGPILRQDVLSIDDLKEGMILKGTVRNVVDFGAFVDIGVKINGLVHKSQIANQFVNNVHDFISVGDVEDFMILSIDREKKRIQLSLKDVKKEKEKEMKKGKSPTSSK